MNLFSMLELSGSALGAERLRAEVVAVNMANAQTTRTPAGGPYRRQLVVFQAQARPRFSLALNSLTRETPAAVRVAAVVGDARPFMMRYEPGHPDANAQGYVAYLRIVFECGLVSAEHLTYREFLLRVPEKTCLASCDLAPFGAIAILQLDLGIAFPLIDVMMGGEGKAGDVARDLTEIEQQILEGVMRIICRDLQTSWQAISLEFNFGACQQISQAQRLMPPEEKNLCLSFEIKMAETRGTLNLAVPALVSNALLRKISAAVNYQRPHSPVETRHQIQRRLLDCQFPVELATPDLNVRIEDLSRLVPGDLLPFPRSATAPALLEIEQVPLCWAAPVRVSERRAARVLTFEPQVAPVSQP
ncbi:MAG: FliM/FliN family flagellar motor switch protein [Terriglobales bacterium]